MSSPQLDLIGIVVEDMARSLAFYRQLGLDLPTDADAQPHVEVSLPGGTRLAWDTIESVRSFDPDHPAPSGNSAIGLAFRLDTAAEVDDTYERLVAAGSHGSSRFVEIHRRFNSWTTSGQVAFRVVGDNSPS